MIMMRRRQRRSDAWTWWVNCMDCGTTSSRRAACRTLAQHIGRASLRGLLPARGGDGEPYYYPTRADRDDDDTGAYALAVFPTPLTEA